MQEIGEGVYVEDEDQQQNIRVGGANIGMGAYRKAGNLLTNQRSRGEPRQEVNYASSVSEYDIGKSSLGKITIQNNMSLDPRY